MIKGIGTDIIEIDRIKKAMDRNNLFINRILTKLEIENLKNKGLKAESVAGRFAAKEAVSKALGTGFRGFSFLDIEIVNDENGKPIINLSDNIKSRFGVDDKKINLSISHNRRDAIAFVVIEG